MGRPARAGRRVGVVNPQGGPGALRRASRAPPGVDSGAHRAPLSAPILRDSGPPPRRRPRDDLRRVSRSSQTIGTRHPIPQEVAVTQPFEPTPSPEPPQPRTEDGFPWIRTLLLALLMVAVIGACPGDLVHLLPAGGPACPVGTGAPVIPGASAPAPAASATRHGHRSAHGRTGRRRASRGRARRHLDGRPDHRLLRLRTPVTSAARGRATGSRSSWSASAARPRSDARPTSPAPSPSPAPSSPPANLEVDLTTLVSDQSAARRPAGPTGCPDRPVPDRDVRAHASPSSWAMCPPTGEEVSVTATGDLTIHGVTKSVQIPLTATLTQDVIGVSGRSRSRGRTSAWSSRRRSGSSRSPTT